MSSRSANLLTAARLLVAAFVSIETPQQSHKFLRQLNDQFEDNQFPALLKLFCIVGESDDLHAKQMLARGLAAALERGDLVSSSLPSWGRSDISHPGSHLGLNQPRPPARSQSRLDPLQYLFAWHSQRTSLTPLSSSVFRKSVEAMLQVFTADPACVAIYRQKLTDDLISLPEGALSALARQKLTRLLELMATSASCAEIAKEVTDTGSSQSRLADLARAQILKG
jgi:hypothetical protein